MGKRGDFCINRFSWRRKNLWYKPVKRTPLYAAGLCARLAPKHDSLILVTANRQGVDVSLK